LLSGKERNRPATPQDRTSNMVKRNITVTVKMPGAADIVFTDVDIDITLGSVTLSRHGQVVMVMALDLTQRQPA
jgi:hypothetical protein